MIRHAKKQDIEAISALYAASREYMRKNGNATQWGDSYPERKIIENDIALERLYVCCDENGVYGAFVLAYGDDPTYAVIDGSWLSDTPYAAIHRVTGGRGRGVVGEAIEYARGQIGHLRIDTHENNSAMRHLIEKNGFTYCGIIHVRDGSPRVAFEWLRK